jgi:hypothetical protein
MPIVRGISQRRASANREQQKLSTRAHMKADNFCSIMADCYQTRSSVTYATGLLLTTAGRLGLYQLHDVMSSRQLCYHASVGQHGRHPLE